MFFRNVTFFRFPAATAKVLAQLDERLAEHPLKPVGPLELGSRGFVSPFGRDEPALSHRIGDGIWLTLGSEDRLLPAVVVNEALQRKLAELEQQEGRRLGGKARARLKDDLIHDMLPKAFVKTSRVSAALDLGHGILAVDTASKKQAESFVSELRHALGSFPALPATPEIAVRGLLTGWISGEPLPAGLALGDECELKDPVDGGAVVKAQRQELTADEITRHLEAGKQVTRLALVLDDHLSFVLGEDGVVRKLKFLEGAVESLENTERDSLHAELDARFALFSGELRRLFAMLETALKISRPD